MSRDPSQDPDLLREVFPGIFAKHQMKVWNLLRRHRLERHEREELHQEVFFELHDYILEHGFPDSIPGLLKKIVKWKVLDHLDAKNHAPITEAMVSSGSEKPGSAPDLDRAMDLRALSKHLISQLPPGDQMVIEKVIWSGLSHTEAAEVLGLTEGQVKARLAAATRVLRTLAKRVVPPSQRGPA